ncbi:MAG: hypothetical protein ABSD64_06775 [Terriglobales bacterium]|jgi:hypothetical protein
MPGNVRRGLIQASNPLGSSGPLAGIKRARIDKHRKLIERFLQLRPHAS